MRIKTVETLYHGTDYKFDTFDFKYAKPFKDYGRGFYLTSSFRQAQKWAQKSAQSKHEAKVIVYFCI